MSTLLRITALLIALLAFVGGCSRSAYVGLAGWGLVPDDFRYGDLYRLSSLPQFKQERKRCAPIVEVSPKLPVALYVIGDSFLEESRTNEADFLSRTYRYTHWENRLAVQLDSSLKNILLLESVERHAREHFARVADNVEVVTQLRPVEPAESGFFHDLKHFFSGKTTQRQQVPEDQLENLLFNGPVWQALKETKARLNLAWFDRTNPKVALSRDEQHLFYVLDTDSTLVNSNFNALPDDEINRMVDSLNATAGRYRRAGFDEVWLSIIPNKTTVVEPERGPYNRLIERVQICPALQLSVIDAYQMLKPGGARFYEISDSHWNCRGRAEWLKAVNERLRYTSPQP